MTNETAWNGARNANLTRAWPMTALELSLDFACGECEGVIGVTVQCTGKGLAAGPRTVAACKVPCPMCGKINQVCFHPTGSVVAVDLVECGFQWINPSRN